MIRLSLSGIISSLQFPAASSWLAACVADTAMICFVSSASVVCAPVGSAEQEEKSDMLQHKDKLNKIPKMCFIRLRIVVFLVSFGMDSYCVSRKSVICHSVCIPINFLNASVCLQIFCPLRNARTVHMQPIRRTGCRHCSGCIGENRVDV